MIRWKEYHLEKCYILENRKLLQEYMKYEIGIGEMAISTVYEKFRIIRNFLKEISDEQQKVTTCDAERIDQYLKKRQEDANEAKLLILK